MVIDDLQKFSNFADKLFNGSNFDNISLNIYSNFYEKVAKINTKNSTVQNEYNFLNYLKMNNTGLKVLKGDSEMNNWQQISTGGKNEILTEDCL